MRPLRPSRLPPPLRPRARLVAPPLSLVRVLSLLTLLPVALLAACAHGPRRGAPSGDLADPNANRRAIDPPGRTLEGAPPRASWIWSQGEPKPRNAYVYLRRSIVLPAQPTRVLAYVSASPVADVRINGSLIERVPMNADPELQVYDRFDLTPFFTAGENVIAALVHVDGEALQHRMDMRGGLFFQADAIFPDGSVIALDTDASWTATRAEAWDSTTPLREPKSQLVGFVERFDARREPLGWDAPGFTADWPAVVVLGPPPLPPWNQILVVRRPFLHRERLVPAQVSRVGEVTVADFGHEVVGYPSLRLTARAGRTIRLGTAARLGKEGTPDTTAMLDYRDELIAREGAQSWQPFTWRAFRYLAVEAAADVRLDELAVEERHFAVEEQGQFSSSDPRLDERWRSDRRAQVIRMQDTLVDTPEREQAQAIAGVSRLAQWFGAYAFSPGVAVLSRYNLVSGAASQRWAPSDAPGAIAARYPTDLLRSGPSVYVPDRQLDWVFMLAEHHLHYGRDELVRELFPALVRLLDGLAARVVPDSGLLGDFPGWAKQDLANLPALDLDGESCAMNALYYGALQAAARLARDVMKDPARARAWQEAGARIYAAVNAHLWGEQVGAYRDARASGLTSLETQLIVLHHGLVPEVRRARVQSLITHALAQTVANSSERSERSLPYWALQTLFDIGEQRRALDDLRARPGLAALLPEEVVGLTPLEPGWRSFAVRPHPADLVWAKARVATVAGDVAASWRRTVGGFELDVLVPPGTTADVTPPRLGEGRVEVDGAFVWPRPARAPSGPLIVDARPTVRLAGGTHRLRVR